MKQLLYLIVVLSLTSCAAIKPDAPDDLVTTNPKEKEVQHVVNSIVIPIEINLSSYLKEADQKVPKVSKGSDYPCTGVRYEYEFTKDKFKINTKSNIILTELAGSYWIKMKYCSSCANIIGGNKQSCLTPLVNFSCGVNERKPSVDIRLATSIGINSNYGVSAKTIISEIKPINPCQVTAFHFDATKEVMKRIHAVVEDETKAIDLQLNKISFREDAQKVWKLLSQSIAIPQVGFLHLQPQDIALVQPKFYGDKMKTTLVLNCTTFLDQNQTAQQKTVLPNLKLITQAPKDTFEVSSDIQLNYDSLSQLFTEQMKGKTVEVKGNDFIFDSIQLSGATDNRVIIQVDFSGTKKGTLFLQGIPAFDNDTKIFSLKELKYDIKTKSILIKMADWLFSNKINEELRKATNIDLKAQFEQLKGQLNASLHQNINGFRLDGDVFHVKVGEISTNKSHINLAIHILARLKIAG